LKIIRNLSGLIIMSVKSYLFISILFFTSVFVLDINSSHALKELNRSTPDLARSSSDIVVAKCVSSEARIDEKTGFIFTYTTFKVDESLKGKYDDELVLRIVGGTVGDKTVSSPYLPNFKPNEEVVLFLGPENSSGYPVLQSINKGIYRVSNDSTATKVITTPVNDLKLYNSRTDQRLQGNDKLSLDDFIYSIFQIM